MNALHADSAALADIPDLLEHRIALLWQRRRPQVASRLRQLAACIDDLAAGTATHAQLHQSVVIAHNLAGALGTFGFPAGTTIARQLEIALSAPTPRPQQLRRLLTRLHAILDPAL